MHKNFITLLFALLLSLTAFNAQAARQIPLDQTITPTWETKTTFFMHDDIYHFLKDAGVKTNEIANISDLIEKYTDSSNLRIGQRISLNFNEDNQLASIIIPSDSVTDLTIVRGSNGKFDAVPVDTPYIRNIVYKKGKVKSSLIKSAFKMDVPKPIVYHYTKAFDQVVNFRRDIIANDEFEILYEEKIPRVEYLDKASSSFRQDSILYASITAKGDKKELFYFATPSGEKGFFDQTGEKVQRTINVHPVNARRISSYFGWRKHPIFKRKIFHSGVDFAAPHGTPVRAAGGGEIAYIGWNKGYGKYIKIRHNYTYSTAYGHLSRFAKSLKRGSTIKKGQVIAYVGSTGYSTGPHLHFELKKHDKAVNPLKTKVPKTVEKLKGKDLENFKLATVAVFSQVAQLNGSEGKKLAKESGLQTVQAK